MILAHNVGRMLEKAVHNIPVGILDDLYVMDNSTHSLTGEVAQELGLKVFRNDVRKGYGGNVKEGLLRGLELEADYIVEIHGDGQFNASALRDALPLMLNGVEFIIGSRFQNPKQALKNGMPFVRWAANRLLSLRDRFVLRLPLTEFHTGFRIYGRTFIQRVPFLDNSDGHLFSYQIIAQASFCRASMGEVPVEADYNDKHTSVDLISSTIYAFRTFHVLFDYLLAKYFSLNLSVFAISNPISGSRHEEMS